MHKFNIDDPRFFKVYDCHITYKNKEVCMLVKFTQEEESARREKFGNDLVSQFNNYHYSANFLEYYDDPDYININHQFSFMANDLEEAFEEFVIKRYKQREADKIKADFWLNMGCA